ncbi:FHA domain-containing protein [Pseudenhygromyxa sp. WMMC2535]|uniref:FHA domain-containing protein n=1 Tax=Pseudenhygromyxa sp. WMMC2535 TaxID=2712867 RepID=UPI0015563160|nr:FHA domain-containing protein [Pseudenhygromyxa sp. WMMC2535]
MRLIIEDLEGSTTVVPLGDEEVTIGRKDHNTIQLTEQNVSRSHAKLIFKEDAWSIQDLDSYNGVKVNGVPIGEATLLAENDLIQIGDYHLTLTDDVDRATVDIERPRAANDGMGSSSTELPSVSVEDLEPIRPANMDAATASAALGYHQGQAEGEEERKGKGGLIAVGLLALVAIIGVSVWALGGGGGEGEQSSGVATSDPKASAGGEAGDAGPDGGGGDGGAAADAGEAALDEGVAEAGAVASAGEDEAVADEGDDEEIIEDDAEDSDGDEVIEDDEPSTNSTKKKSTKKSKSRTKSSQPKSSGLSPDAALDAARKAMVGGNNSKAYSLAKEAYDGGKGNEALSLMGVTACKMGSKSKAKAAYKKLPQSKKEMLEKVCGPLGIEL